MSFEFVFMNDSSGEVMGVGDDCSNLISINGLKSVSQTENHPALFEPSYMGVKIAD